MTFLVIYNYVYLARESIGNGLKYPKSHQNPKRWLLGDFWEDFGRILGEFLNKKYVSMQDMLVL